MFVLLYVMTMSSVCLSYSTFFMFVLIYVMTMSNDKFMKIVLNTGASLNIKSILNNNSIVLLV